MSPAGPEAPEVLHAIPGRLRVYLSRWTGAEAITALGVSRLWAAYGVVRPELVLDPTM